MSFEKQLPFVSIILPVRNEEHFIDSAVTAIFAQEYPSDRFELIVAEGMSTDRTHQKVQDLSKHYPNIRLIENPKKIVPTGLNLAIQEAKGDVVIRMDGHCQYPKDYVSKVVGMLEQTGAANVGGVLVAVGDSTYAQTAIRLAYQSPLSAGTALRSYESHDFTKEVDDVHGGCWRKDTLISVGCFDEMMVRNQDDELSFRIRKQGGRILQDASIRVRYFVRDSFGKLYKQFMQYGYWKVPVIQKHPKQASLRHAMPALLVGAFIVLATLSVFSYDARVILGLFAFAYLAAITLTALIISIKSNTVRHFPGVSMALLCMHFGYGVGFILGLYRLIAGRVSTDNYFERLSR